MRVNDMYLVIYITPVRPDKELTSLVSPISSSPFILPSKHKHKILLLVGS